MRRVPVQPPAATEDARPFSVNGRDSTKQRQRLHRAPEGRVRKSPPRQPLARAAAPRIRRRSERPRRPRRGADSALRLGGHEGPVDPQALLRVTPGPTCSPPKHRPPSTEPRRGAALPRNPARTSSILGKGCESLSRRSRNSHLPTSHPQAAPSPHPRAAPNRNKPRHFGSIDPLRPPTGPWGHPWDCLTLNNNLST